MATIGCKLCGDVITSKDRHDFKYCKCHQVFIDGGNDYIRVGFPGEVGFENSIQFMKEKKS